MVRAGRGHHRAQDRRGQDQPSGALRCADRAAQPRPSSATAWSGALADGAPERHVRHPLHRPRPVQAGQRYARPSPRRHAAVRGRRAAARASCATADMVARFGGDEFVVLQAPVTVRSSKAAALAERMVERPERHLRDRRPRGRGQRQHRHRARRRAGGRRGPAAAQRRHGAVPREGRRPRAHGACSRPRWKRARRRAAASSSTCAARWRTTRSSSTTSRSSTSEHRRIVDLRGAAALAASRARHGLAGASSSRVAEEMGLIVEIGN